MNTKLFTTITVLAAVSGSTVLFTGCQPEWEPMPPGVYIQPVEKDPERVDVPKTDTVLPAPADLSTPAVPAVQEQPTVLPSLPPPPAVTPKKPVAPKKIRKVEVRKEEIRYVVKKGDSLARIAYRFGLKIKTLKEYNNLKKNVIHPKQILLIPPTSSADKVSANLKDVKNPPAKVRKGKRKGIAIPADGIHKVKARENFTTIARLYGIRVADMVAANPGVDSARLKVGQKLNIAAGAGKEEGAAVAPAKKDPAKKPAEKPVNKVTQNADDKTVSVKDGVDKETPKDGGDAVAPEDDLFKEIKSPEEAAAPAVPAAKESTPAATTPAAATPADNIDILGSDDNGSAKVDKVVPTSDGRIQITLAEATTLENLAAKYQTTAELLRKENSSLPASGELKAGTVIILGTAQ